MTAAENNMFDHDDEVFVVLQDDRYAWVGRYRPTTPEWVCIVATMRVCVNPDGKAFDKPVDVSPPKKIAFPSVRVHAVSHFDREKVTATPEGDSSKPPGHTSCSPGKDL